MNLWVLLLLVRTEPDETLGVHSSRRSGSAPQHSARLFCFDGNTQRQKNYILNTENNWKTFRLIIFQHFSRCVFEWVTVISPPEFSEVAVFWAFSATVGQRQAAESFTEGASHVSDFSSSVDRSSLRHRMSFWCDPIHQLLIRLKL